MIYDVQKASVLKRASAFLLDIILIACLAVGFMALLSLICDYDTHYNVCYDIQQTQRTAIIEKYKQPGITLEMGEDDTYSDSVIEWIERYQEKGIDLGIESEEYEKLTEDQQQAFIAFANQANAEHTKALYENATYMKEYNLWMSLTLMMTSIGILLAVLIWEFIVPLFLKNGQTVGKKVFGIAVMHTNGLRVRPFSMFVRAILGKYVFEIMVPVYLAIMMYFGVINTVVGAVVLVLILVLQIAIFVYTKNTSHSFLHDLISRTVTVDLASQMIFDSEEEMLEFKKQEQNTIAERNDYKEHGGFDFYNSSLNSRGGKKIVDENGEIIKYDEQSDGAVTDESAKQSEAVVDENENQCDTAASEAEASESTASESTVSESAQGAESASDKSADDCTAEAKTEE